MRLPPVYCRIKRSDCYVMDHLYASTLNSALRSSRSHSLLLSLSFSLALSLEVTEIYIGPKTALAPSRPHADTKLPGSSSSVSQIPEICLLLMGNGITTEGARNFYWPLAAFKRARAIDRLVRRRTLRLSSYARQVILSN